MEPIGNILRLPKEKTPAMEEEARKIYLEKLLLLPSTEELLARLEHVRAIPLITEQAIKNEEARVQLAYERDEIAKGRPEGCKCLGLGIFRRWDNDFKAQIRFTASGEEVTNFCSCPDGQARRVAREEERKVQQVEALTRRIENVWECLLNDPESAGIPYRFQDFRFATAPPSVAKDAMVAFLEADEDVAFGSWFLFGPYGSGKTGLAVSYAWESLVRDLHGTILFRSTPQLLTELRATYNKENEGLTETALLEKYQSVGLLILDDLGAEQITGSGWVADRLYQIIGGRHAEKQATLFTSNLFLDALAERIGERITWRILEMCGDDHILEVKGPNLRDFRKGG